MDFWETQRVVVTGGAGFLGSHLCDLLAERGNRPFVPRSRDYDLRSKLGIQSLFDDAGHIDILFHLAANVGGIGYNQRHPYALFHDNAVMGIGLIHQAIRHGVGKFVQVGTVCAYPKHTRPPFVEKALWDGYPEETNAPYGLAKKMLLVQLQAARAEFGFNGVYLLLTNLYGPRDEFDPQRSHVIPALIRKCVEARDQGADSVTAWGTGNPSRDFLFVRDAAEGLLLAAERYNRPEPLNLGSGREVKIAALLHFIMAEVGYQGRVIWDVSKPDGQPRRVLNSGAAKAAIGWSAKTPIQEGLRETIGWYEAARQRGAAYNERSLLLEVQLA